MVLLLGDADGLLSRAKAVCERVQAGLEPL